MPLSSPSGAVRLMLKQAGLKPNPEQMETTKRLYQALAERLARVPAGVLENVEPDYIQPLRRGRRRHR